MKRPGGSDSWLAVFPRILITSREDRKLTLSFRWLVPHRVRSESGAPQIDPYHELSVEAMGRPPAAWESIAAEGLVTSDVHMPVPLDVGPLESEHGYIAFAINGLDKNGLFIGQVGSISESLLTTTTLELRDDISGLSKLVRVTGWEYIEAPTPQHQPASGVPQRSTIEDELAIKILFLAANPAQTSRLDLAEELRSLEEQLRAVKYRDAIKLIPAHAVRRDDLIRLVREHAPNIIHFSGHGSTDGIILMNDKGGYEAIDGAILKRILIERDIDLIVLNACYSKAQADEIGDAVKAGVGTTDAVKDEAACRFTVAFYRTLGNGYSIKEAFRDGGDAAAMPSLPDVFYKWGELDHTIVGATRGPAPETSSQASMAGKFLHPLSDQGEIRLQGRVADDSEQPPTIDTNPKSRVSGGGEDSQSFPPMFPSSAPDQPFSAGGLSSMGSISAEGADAETVSSSAVWALSVCAIGMAFVTAIGRSSLQGFVVSGAIAGMTLSALIVLCSLALTLIGRGAQRPYQVLLAAGYVSLLLHHCVYLVIPPSVYIGQSATWYVEAVLLILWTSLWTAAFVRSGVRLSLWEFHILFCHWSRYSAGRHRRALSPPSSSASWATSRQSLWLRCAGWPGKLGVAPGPPVCGWLSLALGSCCLAN
jgi:hypothetical protein